MDNGCAKPIRRAPCAVRAGRIAAVAVVALGGFTAAKILNRHGAWLLHNDSASEAEGLYLRTGGAPAVGRVVAFMAPAAAGPYVERHLAILHRTPVLKTLAAGPGDFVCSSSGRLVIDGQVVAAVAAKDPRGVRLPQWDECRRLRAGEWFAFSDRVPNSFDSRYFGPIRTDQVIAAYRPLWVTR